jgi:hypothetical protein
MKLNNVIASVVPSLLLALGGQAAQTNTLDWKFSTFGSTNIAPTTAVTPSGGTPVAAVIGNNNTYFFGSGPGGPNGPFGSPTGLWDVEGGTVRLNLRGVIFFRSGGP